MAGQAGRGAGAVRALLESHGLRPSRGLGQNFLISETVTQDIVTAAELAPDDVVLEVGPGLGLMTEHIAAAARAVVAVELDRRMVALLVETLAGALNVHVVQGDILEVDPPAAVAEALGVARRDLRYKVVANLPYYITSAALRHLLEASPRPDLLVVMVQREVAERIVAGPGDMSLLAVGVQVYGRPEVVRRVSAGAFYPRPKVDSAVVRVEVSPEPQVPEALRERFFGVVRAGFGQKRKQIVNSLSSNLGLARDRVLGALAAAGVAPERRAQTLAVSEWLAVTRALEQADT